jgi:NAD(P)-dependent dehydrogenase (short-subunit alcohol dehydrogenase family)
VESAFDAATALFGVPTVLVNNTGVPGPVALTAELTDDAYHRTIEVDAHGVFNGMHAAIPGIRAVRGDRSSTSRRPQPNSRSGDPGEPGAQAPS